MESYTDGAFFLWVPVHEGIQWKHFHIIITCQLAWKRQHISLINLLSIILCISWFKGFCLFSPEGLFTARFSWISVEKKTGTNILPAFFLFPISLLPKGKSWLFLCTCRILHISAVWHVTFFPTMSILNDFKFDWEWSENDISFLRFHWRRCRCQRLLV